MSISTLANAFNSVYIKIYKVLRCVCSQFKIGKKAGYYETKQTISAFICEFLPALPRRTMRQSAIKLVIDAALNRPRITWQLHRLTNRVT